MEEESSSLLAVGIDWAESFHDVALGRPDERVVEQFRVDHTAAGIERLVARCLGLEADPSEIRVVLETRHGLLVEALIDAGFTVLPVNPDMVARRRGPAKKKDDAEDARICCLLALDQFLELRKLIPHGDIAGELRAIARDDERACRDERRLLNRLRADLMSCFPAMLMIAGADLGAAVVLKLLARWPSHAQLAAADPTEIEAFARAARHGWPDRFAARIADTLAAEQLPAKDYLVRAKTTTIALTAIRDTQRFAMLCRDRPGHQTLRPWRIRRRPTIGPQPIPRHRRAPMGILQPPEIGVGPPVLRLQDRCWKRPPQRAARTGQPMDRNPVALPHQTDALRRKRPSTQPATSPPAPHRCLRLTEGVSPAHPHRCDRPGRGYGCPCDRRAAWATSNLWAISQRPTALSCGGISMLAPTSSESVS
ncbi:IS110 family transposase [Nocardia gipuzkoensis]